MSARGTELRVRDATVADLPAIGSIYNQGIADRQATLDVGPKDENDMRAWLADHGGRYAVLVAERNGEVVGWASLNSYSHRCAYDGVADLSIYVAREHRSTGIGTRLLPLLERRAIEQAFHKIVLFALASNDAGARLYSILGYRHVGVFREQGRIDEEFVDVIAMEKILKRFVLFVCRHNTGRSQMAEAYLRHFLGDAVEIASAGTTPAERLEPVVVEAMAEDGIDISGASPKVFDERTAARADRIITMGCDVEGLPRIDDDWGLPDPKGRPLSEIRTIRESVKARARALAESLR
ncbi:MAG TPA: arsinothricin resistance N-acetyltransferase ArsN1 family A [Candidatus Baltobacteraceae bacterium]|jgi:phosphinothricin acetyltransferase